MLKSLRSEMSADKPNFENSVVAFNFRGAKKENVQRVTKDKVFLELLAAIQNKQSELATKLRQTLVGKSFREDDISAALFAALSNYPIS